MARMPFGDMVKDVVSGTRKPRKPRTLGSNMEQFPTITRPRKGTPQNPLGGAPRYNTLPVVGGPVGPIKGQPVAGGPGYTRGPAPVMGGPTGPGTPMGPIKGQPVNPGRTRPVVPYKPGGPGYVSLDDWERGARPGPTNTTLPMPSPNTGNKRPMQIMRGGTSNVNTVPMGARPGQVFAASKKKKG